MKNLINIYIYIYEVKTKSILACHRNAAKAFALKAKRKCVKINTILCVLSYYIICNVFVHTTNSCDQKPLNLL